MRILVVDDDHVCRVKLSELLDVYGECDIATHGEMAIELFSKAHEDAMPYELISMDIEMPNMNGPDVVGHIRDIEKALDVPPGKEVKILMVTSLKAFKDVSTSFNEGCDGYLNKPATAEEVKKALGQLGVL